MATDINDNEMLYLETIHLYVEILDSYFKNVQERHIMYNFYKCYQILDEFIIGGEILETNKANVLERMQNYDKLEKEQK